jgi:hypothetical protein
MDLILLRIISASYRAEGDCSQQRAAEDGGQAPQRLPPGDALGQGLGQVVESVFHAFLLS